VEQRIRFCKTADGVQIAYATLGEGPPLVYVSGWPVHLEIEWEKPSIREFLIELGAGFTLIRYDMRGTGLSDRVVPAIGLTDLMRDLEAVIDHLSLRNFALLSLGDLAGPIAVTYAASHSDRVTHLILHAAFARGPDLVAMQRRASVIDYVSQYGFPVFQFVDAPGVEIEQVRAVEDVIEQGAPHALQAALLRILYSADVSRLLDAIVVPTLVLHARGDPMIPLDLGREVAARIKGADFVPFDSASNAPWANSQAIIGEIRRFLAAGDGSAPSQASLAGLTRREIEVLILVAAGRSNRQIGEELSISLNTVDRHVSNILTKIGATNRAEAASFAVRHGLAY
jgi:pimeloyl-ACP methyl ester carboxylesterase/DNA-binding CsgD family transcriptional regulator